MSESPERLITVEENGQVVYRGKDKRFYNNDYIRCGLGVPIYDWIKVGIYIIGVLIFIVKADVRLRTVEDNQAKLTTLVMSLKDYSNNADNWNSSNFGVPFNNGKPIDGSYRINNRRRN